MKKILLSVIMIMLVGGFLLGGALFQSASARDLSGAAGPA